MERAENMTYEEFVNNVNEMEAAERRIEKIGLAAKDIPEDVQKQYDHIPWRNIIGMRNVIAHIYLDNDIDPAKVWEALTRSIPETLPKIQIMLQQEERRLQQRGGEA